MDTWKQLKRRIQSGEKDVLIEGVSSCLVPLRTG